MPNSAEHEADAENSTQRIEAFSDGVFAIAITLLILEVNVPHVVGIVGRGLMLRADLVGLWPAYFAYVFSFVTVGIYWVNHHYIFKLYQCTDHLFNLLNVFFLMCISFLPFPTAVLGAYMMDSQARHTAIIFYVVGLFLPAFAWSLAWFYASRGSRLDSACDGDLQRNRWAGHCARSNMFVPAAVASSRVPAGAGHVVRT